MRWILAAPVLSLGLSSCLAWGVPARARNPEPPPELTTLCHSLDPLREHFNETQDAPRMITIVSPTCGTCRIGLDETEATLERLGETDLRVAIVWLDMLPSDCEVEVRSAMNRLNDDRVRHFYDPRQMAGRMFARGLLPVGVAWDIYLFYGDGVTWERERPPRPTTWAHQLGRVAARHFHPRDALGPALRAAWNQLGCFDPESELVQVESDSRR